MASDAGFDLRALAGKGSGPDGRIVRVDVERALAGGAPPQPARTCRRARRRGSGGRSCSGAARALPAAARGRGDDRSESHAEARSHGA